MRRILFVDDETNVLDGLRRLLHPLRPEWEMGFAQSGPEALRMMSDGAFDVLVTDIRMPGMDGTELLTEVRNLHPQVLRIILSGQADQRLTLQSAATAHQYLSKPCDAETLRQTVSRAGVLHSILSEPSLQALVAGAKSLPSVPALYTELVRELESPDASIETVARVIARDTAMTAKILQLANSAFFGARRCVTDPKDAVLCLGFDIVKALTLGVKVFSQFQGSTRFSVDAIARHSVLTGALARSVAQTFGASPRETEEAFMAGLLHDVGKLVLMGSFPKEYDAAVQIAVKTGKSGCEAEQEVFGTTHTHVGTYLFCLWGFTDTVIDAVAYHHWPDRCPTPGPSSLTAVHVANFLSFQNRDPGEQQPVPELDLNYIESLDLTDRMPVWHELVEK